MTDWPFDQPGTALQALARARAAWEATQPQLFIELWPDGLEETPSVGESAGVSSSPPSPTAPPPAPGRGGGLANGVGRRERQRPAPASFAPLEGRVDRRQ